ncbi:hypothetical protein [Glaciimonas immobilis]|uniref:Uncharacterized protein n=1 Tax=Glaciimonas immobilis TaxID=728004 RepID=A0A840S0T2_9BURK|nr:hypothetical protein [Glaciimonas immobilis]KAF3995905.1 hypothetical protein HAV38_21460 [Glaciimonas immobilis]MBB5202686.1 hypothetical protein [Glaciimonas immobilis]
MNPEPIAHPNVNPHHKEGDAIPEVKSDVDNALDEALEESFPASDPVAITIANPPKKSIQKRAKVD